MSKKLVAPPGQKGIASFFSRAPSSSSPSSSLPASSTVSSAGGSKVAILTEITPTAFFSASTPAATPEEKARSEANRQAALARRTAQSSTPSATPAVPSSTTTAISTPSKPTQHEFKTPTSSNGVSNPGSSSSPPSSAPNKDRVRKRIKLEEDEDEEGEEGPSTTSTQPKKKTPRRDEDEDAYLPSDDDMEDVKPVPSRSSSSLATPSPSSKPFSSFAKSTSNPTTNTTPKPAFSTPAKTHGSGLSSFSYSPSSSSPSAASPSPNKAFQSAATLTPATDKDGKELNDNGHVTKSWLRDIRDKLGRTPKDPDYNPRTLQIPSGEWKKMTPAEEQYWQLKSENFDMVLFFKVGKFYELFDDDAYTGVQELNLNFMTGAHHERPHAGFPEAALEKYAKRLVDLGYRIGVVEQVETPKQLAAANAVRGAGQKKRNVVNRQMCSVLTPGTLTEPMMMKSDDASWLMALTERERSEEDKVSSDDAEEEVCDIGITFVDTATGRFFVGQFPDDRQRSHLKTLLGQISPVELVLPGRQLSAPLEHVLRTEVPHTVLRNTLADGTEFWDSNRTISELRKGQYFYEKDSHGKPITPLDDEIEMGLWPTVLQELTSSNSDLALSAVGACTFYLRRALHDTDLLAMSNFHHYKMESLKGSSGEHLVLDGQTLNNLEIIRTAEGTAEGSLFKKIDSSVTAFGRRMLKDWMTSPLANIEQINHRLDAVECLMSQPELLDQLVSALRPLPDLERLLARIHANGMKAGVQAVMYENVDKKKMSIFLKVLEGFDNIIKVIELFSRYDTSTSKLLQHLTIVEGGGFPDLNGTLEYFKHAFDHSAARTSDHIVPVPGVNEDYDQACADIEVIVGQLDQYLLEQRRTLGDPSIKYFAKLGEEYQLEIKLSTVNRLGKVLGSQYAQKSSTKDCRRYWTTEIEEMISTLDDARDKKSEVLKDVSRQMFATFASHSKIWNKAINSISQLDCLRSLALVSRNYDGASCRPQFVDFKENGNKALLELRDAYHPVLASLASASTSGKQFIPNDTVMGIDENPSRFVLVSGPNMGGKSTLLRQTCTTVLLAQLGCYAPASHCRLTPVDRIFTRVGANDKIMSGQSTFLVELMETANIIKHASPRSLVILDELGRGTSTFDGTAIAYSVIEHLSQEVGCLTLFATHYHMLMEEFAHDPLISMYHMGCEVDAIKETVVYLYKFIRGTCPKSYGMNVANLAGLPESVVLKAKEMSEFFEERLEAAHQQNDRASMLPFVDQACQSMAKSNLQALRDIWNQFHQHAQAANMIDA